MSFKKEQKLLCINPIDELSLNKIYIAACDEYEGISGEGLIKVHNHVRSDFGFYTWRFVDAEKYLHDQKFKSKMEELIDE